MYIIRRANFIKMFWRKNSSANLIGPILRHILCANVSGCICAQIVAEDIFAQEFQRAQEISAHEIDCLRVLRPSFCARKAVLRLNFRAQDVYAPEFHRRKERKRRNFCLRPFLRRS